MIFSSDTRQRRRRRITTKRFDVQSFNSAEKVETWREGFLVRRSPVNEDAWNNDQSKHMKFIIWCGSQGRLMQTNACLFASIFSTPHHFHWYQSLSFIGFGPRFRWKCRDKLFSAFIRRSIPCWESCEKFFSVKQLSFRVALQYWRLNLFINPALFSQTHFKFFPFQVQSDS